MLQRIRTLAVQAANGTNTDSDRKALQQEVTQLCAEISRIAKQTTFAVGYVLNGKQNPNGAQGQKNSKSLIPNDGKLTFQVGANAGDTLALNWGQPFTFTGINGQRIGGAVTVSAFAEASKTGLVKSTANTDVRFSVSKMGSAQKTLEYVDSFIQVIDSKRAELGAIQNQMESTIRNQASIAENEADARSRIRDTDFASETAALTANNIIQQASQTVLAQANQRPTIALSLLGQ